MENVGFNFFSTSDGFLSYVAFVFLFFCNVFLLILVGLVILMDGKDFFC